MAPTWSLAEATDAARDPDLRHRIGPAVDQPVVVAVPGADDPDHAWIAATRLVRRLGTVVIGVGDRPRPAFDVIDSDPGPLADAVRRRPQTASIAAEVLRLTEHTEAATARQIESLAYAALQGGPEHASWLASRGRRVRRDDAPRVRVDDDGDTLTVTLTRGRLHNLLDTAMRDELADVFVALERPPGPTLDVGCGTGIVGRALQERGVDGIHGVDISPQMLEQASSKGVYETLIEADLTAGLRIGADTYAGVASAGTFTHGHLPPEPLGELIRVSMPGAACAIGVNAAHFVDRGFATWLDAAVSEERITPYSVTRLPVYDASDPTHADDMSDVVTFRVI